MGGFHRIPEDPVFGVGHTGSLRIQCLWGRTHGIPADPVIAGFHRVPEDPVLGVGHMGSLRIQSLGTDTQDP